MARRSPPYFTVVVPLYNKEKYVGRTLASILSQTDRDFEALVINDGSTDGSEAVARSFRDPRIRILRQRNQGVAAARNRGIRESASPLVAFLDADDEYKPGFLAEIRRLAGLYPGADAYGTTFAIHKRLRNQERYYRRMPRNATGFLPPDYFLATRNIPLTPSSVAVRRRAFRRIGYFRVGLPHGEDIDLWFRMGIGGKVAYSNRPLSIHHVVPGSMSTGSNERNYDLLVETPDRLLKGRLSPGERERVEEYRNLQLLKKARDLIAFGNAREAREVLKGIRTSRFLARRRLLALSARLPLNLPLLSRNLRKWI